MAPFAPKIKLTGLSGNEIYCLSLKGLTPSGVLIGNSIQSLGFMRSFSSGWKGLVGGEVEQVTELIHEGRAAAFARLVKEAEEEGVHGVAGVSSELRQLAGNCEFLFVGTGVSGAEGHHRFTSSGDAQELYCHMDAGYEPLTFAFGNVAYSMGAIGGLRGAFRTMQRGEVKEYSNIFNLTRHQALSRMVEMARHAGANSVVGVRTNVMWFQGLHEMYMTGTGAFNDKLPQECSGSPVTSDLTGEELWSMAALGYVPVKLLLATSVYSLGALGGITAAFKGFSQGEIPELTSLVYDAREKAFDILRRDAEEAGAEEIVGIKTYILELAPGLIEVLCVGTGIKKMAGIGTQSQALPAQAIIRDKDTWLSGDGGFNLMSTRAGG